MTATRNTTKTFKNVASQEDTTFITAEAFLSELWSVKPRLAHQKATKSQHEQVKTAPLESGRVKEKDDGLPERVVNAEKKAENLWEAKNTSQESVLSDVSALREEKKKNPDSKVGLQKQRVAAYIRVSTESADQENSYEIQERYFKELLSGNTDWISAGIYSDYGITGTSKAKRSGFKRLLRHCQEGRIDRIMCKSISRFARNTADFLMALKILKDSNVTICFEKECLDTADPMNEFVVTTLAAVAQQESYSISENINLAIEKRFRNGEVQNVEIYGYRFNGKWITTESGYRYKDIDIMAEEAEVVRRIFAEFTEGYSFSKIARGLNLDGIPSPKTSNSKKKHKEMIRKEIDKGWTASRIRYIVKNERYIGDVLIQKTYTDDYLTHKQCINKGEKPQYLLHAHHPAIVERELFQQAKTLLEAKKKGKSRPVSKHSLSGMIVCANCGRFFNVHTSNRISTWYCPSEALNNGKRVCSTEKVSEKQIEKMLRKAITERFHGRTQLDNESATNLQAAIEAYASAKEDFVEKMQARLEAVQKHDNMEHDRAYISKQLTALRVEIQSIEKKMAAFRTEQEAMMLSKEISLEDNSMDSALATKTMQIENEQKSLEKAKTEEEELIVQLEKLESYWEALEENFDEREKAIEWLSNLDEKDKMTAFYDGLLEHLKAFVLSITVLSANQFTIHWFDNSESNVVLGGY